LLLSDLIGTSYRNNNEVGYPMHDWTATITPCGRICWHRHKINVSVVFAGQNVGVRQVSDRIWLVSFTYPPRIDP
jgi:putative transposase